ncbi:WSC domain-containing protein [Paramyrothecium foliicola]|nr:WSC domain-containing protein [Paramyrothecium foliicola]
MKNALHFSATTACLAILLAAPQLCSAGPDPLLDWDPETISPCLMWEDNGYGLSCEYVRKYWNITAEEFTRWNPSVGLDCKPWRYQSYCVVPKVRLPATTATSTTAKPTTTTSTTSVTQTLGPSPTSWAARGCYVDDKPDLPVLEKRISKEGGDAALTIAKCQESCYQAFLKFAGVKAGNECWCSSFIGGELAKNATLECNNPCTGDLKTVCGGKDRLNIFEPVGFKEVEPVVSRT